LRRIPERWHPYRPPTLLSFSNPALLTASLYPRLPAVHVTFFASAGSILQKVHIRPRHAMH
jgi:hypothetical protein